MTTAYTTKGGGEGVTTLTRPVSGEEHNSSRNLEISSGIRRLSGNFLGNMIYFKDMMEKNRDT